MYKILRKFCMRMLRKLKFLPPKIYAHFLYEHYTGKRLNLYNPQEFNEKIQWYKVFFHPKILNQLVDKYAVRAYVKNSIGEEYLNELYNVYNNANDIDYNELPDKFVIKATHASSYNLIVKNKKDLNIKKTNKLLNKWLQKSQYYRTGQEWAYKDVKPRLIIEKFLKDGDHDSLIDYKFYCFNGDVKFVEIHFDRAENHKRGFYDLDFKPLPFRYVSLEKSISTKVTKPLNFNEMIELSKKLSKSFPFVRVDFYSINGKSIFGEMTFYPSDGRKDFIPAKYNKIIGDYFILPKMENGETEITKIT